MKKITYILLVVLGLTLVASCSSNDDTCRKSKAVFCKVGVYLNEVDTKTNKVNVKKLTIDSLTAKGLEVERYVFEKAKTNLFPLPLNKFEDKSVFELMFNETKDTLEILYKNTQEYLSLSCGAIRTYEIDTAYARGHFIDSLSLVNKKVNTSDVEHIQIHHFK